MHLSSRLLAVAVSLVIVVVASAAAAAQDSKGNLRQAAQRLARFVEDANRDGFTFPEGTAAIRGGWLQQGPNGWVNLSTVPLTAGKSYRFMSAGDLDATDVDLRILDQKGNVVATDYTLTPDCIFDFRPKESAEYTMQLRLFASRKNVPALCLAAVMIKK